MKHEQVHCNQCGQKIQVYAADQTRDYLKIEKTWGYFSQADGVMHRINICESCYHQWIRKFTIPVEEAEVSELL